MTLRRMRPPCTMGTLRNASLLLANFAVHGVARGWQSQADAELAVWVDTGNDSACVRSADIASWKRIVFR